jgi:hypothetical protein
MRLGIGVRICGTVPLARSDFVPQYEVRFGRWFRIGPDFQEMVRPWGLDAGAWRRRSGLSWRDWEPEFNLPELARLGDSGDSSAAPARFLLGSWPERARALAGRFAESHWSLLQFCNRQGEAAMQMLESNPAIGMLLAQARRLGPLNEQPGDLLSKKRREIAAWFGFPASEACVRILAKVTPPAATVAKLRCLRDYIGQVRGAEETLSRLPRLNEPALSVLFDPLLRREVPPVRLSALAQNDDDMAAQDYFDEIAKGWRERMRLVQMQALPRGSFPAPPVDGIEAIAAIRTKDELVTEGRLMHNCVADYAGRVKRGTAYIYRMTAPERATICIVPSPVGWILEEAKGPCNRALSYTTHDMIRAWLRGSDPHFKPLVFGLPPYPARPRRPARNAAGQMGLF